MRFSKGQSLFELLMAFGVIALILVAVVSLALTGVRNSTFSKNRTQAEKYGIEAEEWLRGQRDAGWSAFASQTTISLTWCAPSLSSWGTSPKVGICGAADLISGTTLKREIIFSNVAPTSLDVKVRVYWSDAQGLHESNSFTSFTDWRAIPTSPPIAIVVNSATSKNCNQVCQAQVPPKNCVDVGTDGSNGEAAIRFFLSCITYTGATCTDSKMYPTSLMCSAGGETYPSNWTKCTCQ